MRRISYAFLKVLMAPLVLLFSDEASGQVLNPNLWVTDGTVRASSILGTTLYVGGDFRHVGPPIRGLAKLDPSAATLMPTPTVDGRVFCIVSDASGGYYIGGLFTRVAGQARTNLAHILSNGAVATWNPIATDSVLCLALTGSNTVLVGGAFRYVGGALRTHAAEVRLDSGLATGWVPNPDGTVITILPTPTGVYLGGTFNHAGGAARASFAAVSPTTGTAMPLVADTDGDVECIATANSTLLIGGAFSIVGGVSRHSLAALDLGTGTVTAWNPSVLGRVTALLTEHDTVYVGGAFSSVGLGVSRNCAAAFSTTTGAPTAWNPDFSVSLLGAVPGTASVLGLASTRDGICCVGAFDIVGGLKRQHAALVDRSGGNCLPWESVFSRPAHVVVTSETEVVVGGEFSSAGMVERVDLAAFDLATGSAMGWSPSIDLVNPSDEVAAVACANGVVYAGGHFGTSSGQMRQSLVAFDATTGQLLPWIANASQFNGIPGRINALVTDGALVYAGGDFQVVDGVAHKDLAALDPVTGAPTGFNPSFPGIDVFALLVHGTSLYVGGDFSALGGAPRDGLGAVNTATGLATTFDPGFGSSQRVVRALATDGARLYVGGSFSDMGFANRTGLASVDLVTGALVDWAPTLILAFGQVAPDPEVFSLALASNTIYVGGIFGCADDPLLQYLGAFDATSALAIGWYAGADGPARSLSLDPVHSLLCVGGSFTALSSLLQTGLGAFDLGQLLMIREPKLGTDVVQFQIEPNPSIGVSTLTWRFTLSGICTVTIHDLSGRRVRELVRGGVRGQLSSVDWDGRDERGTPCQPGIYVAELVLGPVRQGKRIVRLVAR